MDTDLPDSIQNFFDHLPKLVFNCLLILLAVFAGLILKRVISATFQSFYKHHEKSSFAHSVIRLMGAPVNYFLPLLITDILIPFMRLIPTNQRYMEKITEMLIYTAVAFILIRGVRLFEEYIYLKYDLTLSDNLKGRKVRTQMQFVRKFMILIIVLLTTAVILLSFDSLRKLGTGLLAGVGVSGIIVGFAAQKSLGNLLAGFQIAFTQPIRIDDVIVVETEYGRVEEITLTYVVLKIWDLRRMVLPITYFIEKPFYNWTRNSADLLGTVFLYLDYTIPVEEVRLEFFRLVATSPLWDKKVKGLQVTDSRERTVELRALMSSTNSSDLFDLRCFVREGLITYIQQKFPDSLPRIRLGEQISKEQSSAEQASGENAQIGIGSGNLVNGADKSGRS